MKANVFRTSCHVGSTATAPLMHQSDTGIPPRQQVWPLAPISLQPLLKFADGKTIAYFRGKKLYGRQLKIPAGYQGVVLSATDDILPKNDPAKGEVDEDEEEEAEVKIMEEKGDFDEVMVWGHEAVMDESDPYVRGLEEWIGFAEIVCEF
jgi:hypothetical protein